MSTTTTETNTPLSLTAIHIPEDASLTGFVKANALDDWGDGPRWASFTINNAWLADLQKFATIVRDNKFALAEVAEGAVWDNEDEHRIRGNRLVITDDSFWFSAYPKHANYDVETTAIGFSSLVKAVTDAVTDCRHTIFFDLDDQEIEEIKALLM
ncbi:MAG: hypothetical protein ACOY4D_05555 [Pseudomonadota bacterium]|jgi:hypothetical protein